VGRVDKVLMMVRGRSVGVNLGAVEAIASFSTCSSAGGVFWRGISVPEQGNEEPDLREELDERGVHVRGGIMTVLFCCQFYRNTIKMMLQINIRSLEVYGKSRDTSRLKNCGSKTSRLRKASILTSFWIGRCTILNSEDENS
jgi:hypothetical protein